MAEREKRLTFQSNTEAIVAGLCPLGRPLFVENTGPLRTNRTCGELSVQGG